MHYEIQRVDTAGLEIHLMDVVSAGAIYNAADLRPDRRVPSSLALWLCGAGSEGYCGCMTTSRDPVSAKPAHG